jgi:membrane associated rhomboid family serine protease
MLIPVGVKDRTAPLVPWVTGAIALVASMALGLTWPGPGLEPPSTEPALDRLAQFWEANPFLEIPRPCHWLGRVLPPPPKTDHRAPMPSALDSLRVQFDDGCRDVVAALEDRPAYRFGFIPARGGVQAGVVTHLLLPWDLAHLVALLLFLLLCATVVEALWGHTVFLAFNVAGGLVGAAAWWAVDPGSPMPALGPLGALGACGGAYAYRVVPTRVVLAVRLPRVPRVVEVEGWPFLLLWVTAVVAGVSVPGVPVWPAVAAHAAGFALGLVVAALMKLGKLERGAIPAWKRNLVPGDDEDMAEAVAALGDQKWVHARICFHRVLARERDSLDATWGLARAAVGMGEPSAVSRELDRLLDVVFAKGNRELVFTVLDEFKPYVDPKALRPAVAFQMGKQVYDPGNIDAALSCYVVAARDPKVAPAALLRAAEMHLYYRRSAEDAAEALRQLKALPLLSAEVARVARDLEEKVADPSRSWDQRVAATRVERVVDEEVLTRAAEAPPPAVKVEEEFDPDAPVLAPPPRPPPVYMDGIPVATPDGVRMPSSPGGGPAFPTIPVATPDGVVMPPRPSSPPFPDIPVATPDGVVMPARPSSPPFPDIPVATPDGVVMPARPSSPPFPDIPVATPDGVVMPARPSSPPRPDTPVGSPTPAPATATATLNTFSTAPTPVVNIRPVTTGASQGRLPAVAPPAPQVPNPSQGRMRAVAVTPAGEPLAPAASLPRANPSQGRMVPVPSPPPVTVELAPSATQVVVCRLAGQAPGGLQLLTTQGRALFLQPGNIRGVGLAVVPLLVGAAGAQQSLLVVDLVVLDPHAPSGQTVIRFRGDQAGTSTVFPPGTPPRAALLSVVTDLARHASAPVWPSPEVLTTGAFPSFASLTTFECTLYGETLAGSGPDVMFPTAVP